MKKEIRDFIEENGLTVFGNSEISLKSSGNVFKTRDARTVFNKVITRISQNFVFKDTTFLLELFKNTINSEEIIKRQEFFRGFSSESNLGIENKFLENIRIPKSSWKPKYQIIIVTDNEKTFLELKKLECPVKYINSSEDVSSLESYDLVQAVNCEELSLALEQLPNVFFLDSTEEAYIERHLELLSGWKENLELLKNNYTTNEIKIILDELQELSDLINEQDYKKLSLGEAEEALDLINEEISENLKTLSISGDMLFGILSQKNLPVEIRDIVNRAIENMGMPEEIFEIGIPVKIDEKELSKLIKKQESEEYSSGFEKIKAMAEKVKKIPQILRKLEAEILVFDFYIGISKFVEEIKSLNLKADFPKESDRLMFIDSRNIFLENAQPISFLLDQKNKCSILTGANSGGKTTLIEHIIQLISLHQIGLIAGGEVELPLFEEVYYFAKTKGSASKGAFENLLTQMSGIKNVGSKTIILADEIEAVTEPGVVGKIICATADFFIKKSCFMVIATHLGREIKEHLPEKSRIDGIEAKGLDENNELIVNHNPILGRLAHSTPELIIEKMARKKESSYASYIFDWINKN